MISWNRYKWPIISILVVVVVLSIMLTVGFSIGILSDAPDGLERVLEDGGVSEPEPFWVPLLSWIKNEYIAGTIGILLSLSVIGGLFYVITKFKQSRTPNQ
ncbi:MAG: hypothetical protein GF317_17465 [Candidatus Lokiarchaeota archaeon]|nr:hypothetical protein [Candidatus Lokiarchaeota archaeon]MBD3201310.1 hypothetical protein [Candidatus Lokiarchaeota archaeon]